MSAPYCSAAEEHFARQFSSPNQNGAQKAHAVSLCGCQPKGSTLKQARYSGSPNTKVTTARTQGNATQEKTAL